jgi:hypothetical protein
MITIGNNGGEHVSICPIGSVNSETGFEAKVEIHVNGFTGSLNPYFEIADISQFYQQLIKLYETLNGIAALTPIEAQFSLRLSGNGRGHIEAKGIAYTYASYGSCLKYEFEIDQSYLPRLIRSLKVLVNKLGYSRVAIC